MVQANELRVGNLLIEENTNSINTVFEIKKNSTRCSYIRIDNGENHISIIQNEYLKPIKLTEEILLNCGASELVKLNDGYLRLNLDGIQLSISPERNFFIEYVHQIPIMYVHVLQNFYFATKQKELEINL